LKQREGKCNYRMAESNSSQNNGFRPEAVSQIYTRFYLVTFTLLWFVLVVVLTYTATITP